MDLPECVRAHLHGGEQACLQAWVCRRPLRKATGWEEERLGESYARNVLTFVCRKSARRREGEKQQLSSAEGDERADCTAHILPCLLLCLEES